MRNIKERVHTHTHTHTHTVKLVSYVYKYYVHTFQFQTDLQLTFSPKLILQDNLGKITTFLRAIENWGNCRYVSRLFKAWINLSKAIHACIVACPGRFISLFDARRIERRKGRENLGPFKSTESQLYLCILLWVFIWIPRLLSAMQSVSFLEELSPPPCNIVNVERTRCMLTLADYIRKYHVPLPILIWIWREKCASSNV